MSNTEQGGYWNTGGPTTYSEADLTSAIEAGVLPVETAIQLRRHVAELQNVPVADEEYFRLISGFNDIFVVIACSLLLVAVGGIFGAASPTTGAALVAVVSWCLAEYFVRRRRMALPAIVLLLTFAGGMATTAGMLLEYSGIREFAHIGAAAFALLAACLHWRRFKVPITVACGTGAAVALAIFLLALAFPQVKDHLAAITGIGGIAVFFLAMRWDSLDTIRQTRRSDVAFWLHLLAAPLLMHPLFLSIGIFDREISIFQALAVVLIYAGVAFVSLCIDRRALMVSSLAYVVYALSALFKSYGEINQDFMLAALVISLVLLLLSAGWQPARSGILSRLPSAARQKLPPARR